MGTFISARSIDCGSKIDARFSICPHKWIPGIGPTALVNSFLNLIILNEYIEGAD